jgi:uncharacterized phage-associated protein
MQMERAMSGRNEERSGAFNAEKALAAIGYLVNATGADLYSVMKMIYLADKAHLGQFGRTITGDMYTAMEKGPVPERAYNLCKFVRGQRSHFDAFPEARDWLVLEHNKFQLKRDPELRNLSKSDLGALDEVVSFYKSHGWKGVADASHDAAWKAAWDEAESRGQGSTSMDFNAIAATLGNGPALIEYLADPHPGEATMCNDKVASAG